MGLRSFVKSLIGQKQAEGTGISAMMDNPQVKKVMKRWGIKDDDVVAMKSIMSGNILSPEGGAEDSEGGEKVVAAVKKERRDKKNR